MPRARRLHSVRTRGARPPTFGLAREAESGLRRRYESAAGARTAQLASWDAERSAEATGELARHVTLPRTIGPYRVECALGVGGMGETFVARRRGAPQGPRVCVKRLLSSYARRPEVVAQFVTEARVLLALDHPNIVRACEFGAQEGAYWLALELVNGMDLSQLIMELASRGARLRAEHCFYVVRALSRALSQAHALELEGRPLGLVHRDISPSNVLLGKGGEVKLADFGIARTHERSTHTLPGHAKGKSGYMAPEQITCRELDGRADLFALGVVMFQLLFGFMPFDGHSDYEIMRRIVNGERAALPPDAAHLPEAAIRLLMSLLATDPDDRPASAAQVTRALDELVTREQVGRELGELVAQLSAQRAPGQRAPRLLERARRIERTRTSA